MSLIEDVYLFDDIWAFAEMGRDQRGRSVYVRRGKILPVKLIRTGKSLAMDWPTRVFMEFHWL